VNWKIMTNFKFSSLLLVPLFAVLAACGGGGGDDKTSTPVTTTPTLKSIAISMASTTIPVTTFQDSVATGTYSDGSTKALTVAGGLVWATKSGGATVASIATGTGRVTGIAVGTETITATQDSIVGSVVVTITAPWTQVSAGGFQTIARRADGKLYAWGQNNWGQLGDSTTTGRTAPVAVNNGAATTAWRQVAVGDQFAVGIRAATTGAATTAGGTLWAWGLNTNGQLGLGDSLNRSVPTQIGKDATWVSVSAGKYHVLALKSDGTLWSWGRNNEGQLGDLTVIGRQAPVKVGGIDKTNTAVWIAFSAGGVHSLGIQKDGSLWTWGDNTSGQLGNASSGTTPVPTPTKIGSLNYTSVSAGAAHSMAIGANGTLWAWGANGSGQLGNNAGVGTVNAPLQISTDTDWTVIAAGGLHTLAVRKDGTLWAWGSNADGQLGSGGTDQASPQQVGTERTWVTVSAGDGHSAGLKADNTLWTWGRNADGQLGNGKTVTSQIPVNIPNPTPN
jgi:alpha-tubulin suppressor-like RCC1 family protein